MDVGAEHIINSGFDKMRFAKELFQIKWNNRTKQTEVFFHTSKKIYFKVKRNTQSAPINGHDNFKVEYNCNENKFSKDEVLNNLVQTHLISWLSKINAYRSNLAKSNDQVFSKIIISISPKFPKIYKEAAIAEAYGLKEICGMGYRKAFEFLVYDYVIYSGKRTKEYFELKYRSLSGEIDECFPKEKTLKDFSKNIAYLGNDFCHYSKQRNLTVTDLKQMISGFIAWIEKKEEQKQLNKVLKEQNENFE